MLVIMDENLTGYDGHWYAYDKAVVAELLRRGLSAELWTSSRIRPDIARELSARPVFSTPTKRIRAVPGAPLRKLAWLPYANYLFFRDASRRLSDEPCRHALAFLPNTDIYQLPAVTLLVRRYPSLRFRLLIRESARRLTAGVATWRKKALLLRLCFRFLAPALASGRVRLCSDSDLIARETAELAGFPVDLMPIPHSPVEPQPARSALPVPDGPCVVLFPGSPRLEKGANLVGQVIRRLQSQQDRDRFAFLVQAVPPAAAPAGRFFDFRAACAGCPNVRVLAAGLSSEEFDAALLGAGIVFLPYRADVYADRTSGICLAALTAGIPVVTTRGTWMGEIVSRWGAGLTCPDGDSAAFAAALREVAGALGAFRAAAARAATSLREFHNPGALVDHILAGFSAAHPEAAAPAQALGATP